MRRLWTSGLGLALSGIFCVSHAEEPSGFAANRTPAVTLGRPVAGSSSPIADSQVRTASYDPVRLDQPIAVSRMQSPEGVPPPPPSVGGVPVSPQERFNCGVVTEAPGSGHFLNHQPRGWWDKCRDFCGGVFQSEGATPRTRFQSDHGFDVMISPVTNPFLFEDPRSLTELRPVFINQGSPDSNPIWNGGQLNFLGLQGRLAFTERLSLVFTEVGWLWTDPKGGVPGFDSGSGFAELRVGPKYTFYRCEPSFTVAAAGVTFDIPIGSSKVFQNTGDLSIEPYISVGQNFARSSWGSFNFMGTVGYSVATDRERTDFLYTSLHLDYDVANLRKIYPLLEFNYFYYAKAGEAQPLDFEGRDLINFGSTGIQGENTIAMAVGLRYKISEAIQFGGAYEFPVSGNRGLLDYRLTFDMIFRY